MVKRKAIEAVEMELQERTFDNNRVYFPAIPKEDGFRRRHFRGMSTVTLVDLRARIDEYQEEAGVDEVDQEKIKLASLYFASAVLGPRRKRKKEVVDPDWMRLVDDINSFNTYPWGRLAYEEVLFGLRKDLRARFEEFTTLAKKRKRDPKFSGFGSLHLSGFVQPLQILAYEIYNGVAEAFATRREDADVSLPRMYHWVTRKWHKNHAPSHSDVVAAFSNSPCEDACEMLTPTDAELLSAHYISGDFVVSNECAVTRRMSELMSRRLKVVCSQRFSPSHDSPSHDSPPPQTPPHRSPPPQTPPHRSPPPQTPTPSDSTPSQSTPQTPPHQTPHHAQSIPVFKGLKSSDMLSFKRAQSPVITTGGETAERAETWTGSPEVAGWTKEARMSQLTPVQEEESGSRESTPEAEGAQVEGNQTEGSTKSIPDLHAFVALPLERRMEIIIKRSWARTEREIEHLSDGEKKRCFIADYQKRFFVEMATPGTWVFTEHVDECFRGLLELKKAYPYIFRGDVAMMDSVFSMIVQGAFIEGGPTNVPETILVYTRGEIDDWPSTPWDKAAFILVPYCFNGHWVLARIVPEAKKLLILDSDHSVDSNCKIILEEVTPLARMMPHILVAMGVQTDTDTQWTVSRSKNFPKQSLSGECGVYDIAAATFTLADRDAYTLNDAIVADFRKYFTCCLWDQSWLLD
ncbi:hypothetical protein F511_42903 [Dorcoceras hygrometricum]|uniref:Ubiquitin-like protease family profile domain-containing protein n=1 Tax=Dorcoceras hygrometricum TaxID=472368 RepID=A0A2Z6ZZ19_9LAMI|nr:hypothetical protein F511_42903 [Dorcoceras hygrometricum]